MRPPHRRRAERRLLLAVLAVAVAVAAMVAWAALRAAAVDVRALADHVPERTAMMRRREAEADEGRSERGVGRVHAQVPFLDQELPSREVEDLVVRQPVAPRLVDEQAAAQPQDSRPRRDFSAEPHAVAGLSHFAGCAEGMTRL